MKQDTYTRREFIKKGGLAGCSLMAYPLPVLQDHEILVRRIPKTGLKLPVVGLGTWQSFDVGNSLEERSNLKKVLKVFNECGGRVIDTSPMYGSAESVIGDLTGGSAYGNEFFFATKVWTTGRNDGISQMQKSMFRMKRVKIDLIQIHNLLDWKTHVKTLRDWKSQGLINYWGITHYLDSTHSSLERVIENERPDFVQFNYSIASRNAENSLLNTAHKHDCAVIINQPFDSGTLFRKVKGKQLPDWTRDIGINSWAQFFLKYIISHPIVSCVIPGTSNPSHMLDNMMAGYGIIPDQTTRLKMVQVFNKL